MYNILGSGRRAKQAPDEVTSRRRRPEHSQVLRSSKQNSWFNIGEATTEYRP